MKQQKMTDYRPNYPRRALRGAALTAAALVAMGGLAGCWKADTNLMGVATIVTPPPEELVLDGEVAICEPPETPEMPAQTSGVLLLPSDTPEH